MIKRSADFDLALDKTRMKDPEDGRRQEATVDALLRRFFHRSDKERMEIQILADEVGMGKTFVALGVAYSVLAHLRSGQSEQDLDGCYQKILIVTPPNSALYAKWNREVSEFVKRCVKEEHRESARSWFAPVRDDRIDRLDDLAAELRRPGQRPRVIVVSMGIFAGGKLRHYDLKRRFLLGCLFRYWGTRFRNDARERLLKGAPSWPRNPAELTTLSPGEQEILQFSEDELVSAIGELAPRSDAVERLLAACQELAAPYARDREEEFEKIDRMLTGLYRELAVGFIRSAFPVVIVDEAHNWKNGTNGFPGFCETIAPRARRALLLTATPFQLRPEEMLEILKVSDQLGTCTSQRASKERQSWLAERRERDVRPLLVQCSKASAQMTKAWRRMPHILTENIDGIWCSKSMESARSKLVEVASRPGIAPEADYRSIIDDAVVDRDPDVREFFREALRLLVRNADLSAELGRFVVRHRRRTLHRAFLVGGEYSLGVADAPSRPDRHVLHGAQGIEVNGDQELPHYVLMRCVSEMYRGQRRASLGSALTGCYSTLLESSEGREAQKRLNESPLGALYLGILDRLVDKRNDPQHPKLARVVENVIEAWRSGEKTLLFCFRVNTAERLRDIIDQAIRRELAARRRKCLGSADALESLRKRFTGRERDLVGLGLDRVLWSFHWSDPDASPLSPEDLALVDSDFVELARVALSFGVDLDEGRLDRVFVHRAVEHVVARRLRSARRCTGEWKELLEQASERSWVSNPYGVVANEEADGESGEEEEREVDDRGVHHIFAEGEVSPSRKDVAELAERLQERRRRAAEQGELSVFDAYARGPSLWFGSSPAAPSAPSTVEALHRHLLTITRGERGFDWEQRRVTLQALRKAILRESVLLRILPDKSEREEAGWGELLAQRFFASLPKQSESMADRFSVFLEDLAAASGSVVEDGGARYDQLDATRLRDQKFVALVSGSRGSRDERTRSRVFAGFNTPLLPEILVCTSVGQEGIDLHRHCRHVVHYDLAWNPAVLEQRTGRVDRIGSKTARERDRAVNRKAAPLLEIGVPFLAGTYDERMFEELRMRAQTFEVLTGGDLSTDNHEGLDDVADAEGNSSGLTLVPLPESMLNDLRVKLHVWEGPSSDDGNTGPAA